MRLKTFRAFSLDEALEAVHADLGTDAAILHTRTFRRGGLFGIGGRELVEIIASEVEPDTSILSAANGADAPEASGIDSSSTPASHRVDRARRAYEDVGSDPNAEDLDADEPSGSVDPPLSSGSLVVDRDRTRALARAMEIRLERQRAAREAAGVEGPDDLVGEGVSPASKPDAASTVPDPPAPEVTNFLIGQDGVLVPDDSEEPSPRVISLESAETKPEAVQGIPVAITAPQVPEAISAESNPENSQETQKPESSDIPSPAVETSRASDPELRYLGETVRKVLDRDVQVAAEPSVTAGAHFADPLASAYAELIGQEFSRDLADRVVETLEGTLDAQARRDPIRVREALIREIADLVPTDESLEVTAPRDGRPRTIAFVGPTGVGKTTTLAKIAATLSLREGLKVGLVTADTYRISAVDQLRTYADILGCTLEVAGDPATMKTVLAGCEGLDAVLIDTPGRSQNDADSLAELRALMDAARPHETHLVLAGTAAERVLLREAEAFAGLGLDRVVLTKLDEAVAFGMLVSVVRRIGRRISWVTTGQEVPRDVEWATGSRIADLVLGGAVKS